MARRARYVYAHSSTSSRATTPKCRRAVKSTLLTPLLEPPTSPDISAARVLTRWSARNNTTLKPQWPKSPIDPQQLKPFQGLTGDMSAVVKTLLRMWDRLEIQNGILYRIWYDYSIKIHRQIIVSDRHKAEVFLYSHDIPSAAHLGVNKTLERLRQTFYWSGMKDDVQDYCNKCDLCSSRKPSKPTKSPLGVSGPN
ncbi:hypothetical protein MAR_035546 [Mya arenaria]|uniref:Integrase zinc-binding domain-containing protein n=1 Tax=Mya arenaria TaxID=6604 RepID=A0ABY7EKT7_MYAAR|nr:hypothetical protein MAR_035546 [Mya arenaria]